MNDPVRDLEPFEREWMKEAAGDVGRFGAARAACPPLALLRADLEDVLPEPARDAVREHVAACQSCAVLRADLASVPPENDVSAAHAARILRDVRRKQRAEAGRRGLLAGWWPWRAAIGATAVAVLAVAAWQWQYRGTPSPGAQAERPAPPRPAAAVAQMPDAFRLEKPEVRLTLATLAWRGTGSAGPQYLTDIAPALDAYREDRYADAVKLLDALSPKYPAAVELQFYLGVSRLFVGDNAGAAAALGAAAGQGAESFQDDIQWYLGLAFARAGQPAEARPQWSPLCEAPGPRHDRACEALKALEEPARPR